MRAGLFQPAACRCGSVGYLRPLSVSSGHNAGPFEMVAIEGATPVSAASTRASRTCFHEAGHAVVSFLVGASVTALVVDGHHPHIAHERTSAAASATIALGGPCAESIVLDRHWCPQSEQAVLASFETVKKFEFGGCDRCLIALGIVRECGIDAPDGELLAAYRVIENFVHELLGENRVRSAVIRLANRAMDDGDMTGKAVHALIEQVGLTFGSRANWGENAIV